MNAQHSLLAKSLPIVAQALGDQLGVKVIIGQTSGASTDGQNIYLPALPGGLQLDFKRTAGGENWRGSGDQTSHAAPK